MKKRELAQHKKVLEEKRDELARSLSDKVGAADRHGDFGDISSAANEEVINIKLKQNNAKLLRAVEDALKRVEAGTYGLCTDCEEEISAARLKAVPWTKVCIECKEKQYT